MKTQRGILKRSRISRSKFNLIVKYFGDDLTAFTTSQLVGVNRHTVERYYTLFRSRIFTESLKDEKLMGEIEVDESYFGPQRVRGKEGRGAGKKIPVVGLLKRNGKVYTKIVTNCSREELMPVIKGKVVEGSTVYTDGWTSYDGLILYGYKHKRIFHSHNEFARGKNHVNGIESFWSYAKRRLRKFNGVAKNKFLVYLKESEWRFNHRGVMEKSLKDLIGVKSHSC